MRRKIEADDDRELAYLSDIDTGNGTESSIHIP